MPAVVGRFAPSPTGHLHYGSLVAALGSWLFAKKSGGNWLLRIDDLDTPRIIPGATDDFFRTLELFGLYWDGEPLFQSRRSERYREALESLVDKGVVYPCSCSRSEIALLASAPHGEELVYPGTCRQGMAFGRNERALRLIASDGVVDFNDGVMGYYSQNIATACGDFVVRRADGIFAYHLATVIDDADSSVNQVVRGADLLSSTPRQILIYRLLDLQVPAYAHLPLVTGEGGAKLSKRDSPISVISGLEPDGAAALLNSALIFLGQDSGLYQPGISCEELLQAALQNFSPGALPRNSAPFAKKTI